MKPVGFLLSVSLFCSSLSAEEPIRERIEWIDIWVTDADYFHFHPKGTMVFLCPVSGATTENTDYARTELREVLDPMDDNVCWAAPGMHVLNARCRVSEVPSSQKVIIGQIHGYSGKANPLIKLQFFKGRIEALVKEKAQKGKDLKLTFPEVGLDKDFDYEIKLKNGV